ncbi:MAG: hypothetical protein II946_00620 [Kiritimatiellae bacterium]|nr:hypothetical protein [Kiritimatiellia bacterium]
MMENIDNLARIAREIERSACAEGIRLPERSESEGPQGAGRMEAACEKNGWYVAVALMPPEKTPLHIKKFGEVPVSDADAQAALNSAVAFAKAEFGTTATVERLEEKIPNTRAPYHMTFLVKVDASKRVAELAA